MYQNIPWKPLSRSLATARRRRGIEYHKRLGQTPELHSRALTSLYAGWPRELGDVRQPADDFYGGTLQRHREQKLPYLKELGVGAACTSTPSSRRGRTTATTARTDPTARPDPRDEWRTSTHLCAEGARHGDTASCSTACIPTPARTAGTSTAAATTARMAPVRDRIRSSIRGTISVTSRMITAAGGASRICRRSTSSNGASGRTSSSAERTGASRQVRGCARGAAGWRLGRGGRGSRSMRSRWSALRGK